MCACTYMTKKFEYEYRCTSHKCGTRIRSRPHQHSVDPIIVEVFFLTVSIESTVVKWRAEGYPSLAWMAIDGRPVVAPSASTGWAVPVLVPTSANLLELLQRLLL
mmetsp:Transcript_77776/g.134749  ORF Transcript_77776/g.134749 Transcript_77776/m.134749 type:complete len:105 (-) Transcript_77776:1117-1431(-)